MITFIRIGLAFSSSTTNLQIGYGYFFSLRALILASKCSILAVTFATSVFRLSSTFCSKSVFPLAFAKSCVCSDSSSVNVLVNSHPTTEKLLSVISAVCYYGFTDVWKDKFKMMCIVFVLISGENNYLRQACTLFSQHNYLILKYM